MLTLLNPGRFARRILPTDVAGLTMWYDPSDVVTVTLISGRVSQLEDKSGNNYHGAQASSPARPTLVAAAINGLDAMHFGATSGFASNRLNLPDPVGITGSQNRSLFTVFKCDTENARRVMFSLGTDESAEAWSWGIWNTGFMAHTVWIGDYISPSLQPGTTDVHIGSVILDGTTVNDSTLGLDGVQEQATGVPVAVSTGIGEASLGSQVGGVDYWHGLIGEVLLYNRALSEVDRQKIEGYLAHKWGLTANLDAGHPYKLSPPRA